jgi:hypothetical protein
MLRKNVMCGNNSFTPNECMNGNWVRALPGPMHLGLRTGPSYPMIYWINPLNAQLNPICPLLELFGAHHILHVSR